MKIKEIPLILFTVFSQAAVGLTVLSTALSINGSSSPLMHSTLVPVTALIMLILAFGASLLHLGNPWGSIRSLTNLKVSWLSREILIFGLYALLLIVDLIFRYIGHDWLWASIVASIAGIIALFISAMIYTSPGFPAIHSPVPLLFFFGTASILGFGLLTLISQAGVCLILKPYLTGTLVCVGLIHLTLPSFWLSGNTALKSTAKAHYGSVLFWIRIVVGFILPIGFLLTDVKYNLALVLFIATGEIMGRVIFFNHMAHASDHIGEP
jgi:DMSO reductase anchor subunit